MDARSAARGVTQRGATSLQFLLASALALVMFLAVVNLVVVQYARGAMRAALDQGARIGAVTHSVSECEARIDQVIGQVLGGAIGRELTRRCVIDSAAVVASGEARVVSWTPLASDFLIRVSATASEEWIP